MKSLLLAALLFLPQDPVASTTVTGRITVDDGSAVPTVNTFRGPNVLVGLQAILPGISSRLADATTSSDGSFVLPVDLVAGTGRVVLAVSRIPLGYHIKSIRHGSTDLLQMPLTVTSTTGATPIEVVLTKTPSSGSPAGVKISGRVTNYPGNPSGLVVSLQSTKVEANGVSLLRLGYRNVNADGTFEFSGVPPGRYRGFTPADSRRDLIGFDVGDRDVTGLEIPLATAGAVSLIMTSVPFGPLGNLIGGSPSNVPATRMPLQPPLGLTMISISQSGRYPLWREGGSSFYRIEQSGIVLEEKRIESVPLNFTLAPGSYELRAYSRRCNSNCGNLDSPEVVCAVPFVVTAGQALYAERILQGNTCTIQFNAPPSP